jgi:hypothetical protein
VLPHTRVAPLLPAAREDERAGSVAATVSLNEHLGERSILTVTAGAAIFRALAPPDAPRRPDDPVRLHYATARDVMAFDPTTERLIG